MSVRTVPIELIVRTYPPAKGELVILELDAGARRGRALKSLFATWAAAAFSAIFPYVHFVLVPALLVAGPFIALRAYQLREMIQSGKGPCPACSAKLTFQKRSLRWPIEKTCPRCYSIVDITPASATN